MPEWLYVLLVLLVYALVCVAVAIPVGRMIEYHTRQIGARVLWYVCVGFLGLFGFLSMSGVGDFFQSLGQKMMEDQGPRERAPDPFR